MVFVYPKCTTSSMIVMVILGTLVVGVIGLLFVYPHVFHYVTKMYKRDIRFIWTMILVKLKVKAMVKRNSTVYKDFLIIQARFPKKAAFLFEDEVWTFTDVHQFSEKVANYFYKQGYRKGDSIGIFLENCPEHPCIWLGLSKFGIIAVLLNTNIVKRSLVHCIKTANCKAIIFNSNLSKAIDDIYEEIGQIPCYEYNRNQSASIKYIPLCKDLEKTSMINFVKCDNLNGKDILMYVYTSGTTGLPKAAVITNERYLVFLCFIKYILPNLCDIIVYSPMPLYHTSGSGGSVALTLIEGATTVLRKKFSASSYWKDCAKYRCNVAQYIGEMCRYVLAARFDRNLKHEVKYIIGNGLQRNIWETYVKKFKIEKVLEFYGATEGNAQMINLDNRVGSVGCMPVYLKNFLPITLVKYDESTGDVIRDLDGLCIKCKANEAGVLVAKIISKTAVTDFKGYLDKNETNKKILLNVFKVGDRYFNSGDVMIYDEFGYFYFKDRIGDTFRWKGENVSTNEVEDAISMATQLTNICVYGVEVPGTEGRTGMAAIVDDDGFLQADTLAQSLKANLPSYAVPSFIRVVDSIPLTGTYKFKKIDLQREGYNINIVKDKLYFLQSNKYVKLTKDLYSGIMDCRLRI